MFIWSREDRFAWRVSVKHRKDLEEYSGLFCKAGDAGIGFNGRWWTDCKENSVIKEEKLHAMAQVDEKETKNQFQLSGSTALV